LLPQPPKTGHKNYFQSETIPPFPPIRRHGLRANLPAHDCQALWTQRFARLSARKIAIRQSGRFVAGRCRSCRKRRIQGGGRQAHNGAIDERRSSACHYSLEPEAFCGALSPLPPPSPQGRGLFPLPYGEGAGEGFPHRRPRRRLVHPRPRSI